MTTASSAQSLLEVFHFDIQTLREVVFYGFVIVNLVWKSITNKMLEVSLDSELPSIPRWSVDVKIE